MTLTSASPHSARSGLFLMKVVVAREPLSPWRHVRSHVRRGCLLGCDDFFFSPGSNSLVRRRHRDCVGHNTTDSRLADEGSGVPASRSRLSCLYQRCGTSSRVAAHKSSVMLESFSRGSSMGSDDDDVPLLLTIRAVQSRDFEWYSHCPASFCAASSVAEE